MGTAPIWRSLKLRARTPPGPGRTALTIDDIRLAAELALPHRMRRQPFTEVKLDEGRMNAILDRANGEEAAEHAPAADGVKKKHP